MATNERLHDTITAIVQLTQQLHDRLTADRSASERSEIASLVESIAVLERDFHRLTVERLSEVTYGALGGFLAEIKSLEGKVQQAMDELADLRVMVASSFNSEESTGHDQQ